MWNDISKQPIITDPRTGELCLENAFAGFRAKTPMRKIYQWFDRAFDEWGGLHALNDVCFSDEPSIPSIEIDTPSGTISVYQSKTGTTPGVYIYIDEQLAAFAAYTPGTQNIVLSHNDDANNKHNLFWHHLTNE